MSLKGTSGKLCQIVGGHGQKTSATIAISLTLCYGRSMGVAVLCLNHVSKCAEIIRESQASCDVDIVLMVGSLSGSGISALSIIHTVDPSCLTMPIKVRSHYWATRIFFTYANTPLHRTVSIPR